MKNKMIAALALSIFTSMAFAAPETAPEADAKTQEMMKKFKEAATPGAQHKTLAAQEGNWTYTSKWWQTADAKPEVTEGTATFKMILGGRWLQQEVKGTAMGQPFEGLGLVGYDNVKKKFVSNWVDNMSTGLVKGEGEADGKKLIREKSVASCPLSTDKEQDFRTEWKLTDKNNMSYLMYGSGPDGGKEFKMMEMVYKRVK